MKECIKHSGNQNPKVIGVILEDYLQSNEPLAVAYREHQASANIEEVFESHIFKDLFPNTELDVDLKLLTREPGRMQIGEHLNGMLTRDGEEHFLFVQNAHMKKKMNKVHRNPIVLCGNFVNVHITEDGVAYPTFNRPRYTHDFTFKDFCLAAAKELKEFSGLIVETECDTNY